MVNFKLCISDPKTTKTYQKEIKDSQAQPFMNLKIGESIKGEVFGAAGFEFKITGGSDYCGFPMRHGILGVRKRITIYGGIGFKGKGRKGKRVKGMKKRRIVCGHKINENISQINLVVVKEGTKKLNEALGVEESSKETPKKEAGKKPEEKHKEEAKTKEAGKKPEEKHKEEAKTKEAGKKDEEKPTETKKEPKETPKEAKPGEKK